MQISKEMLIGELLQVDENMAQILMGAGMHCIGCPSSQMESLEEACMVHGIPVEKLVSVINEYLAQKQHVCDRSREFRFADCAKGRKDCGQGEFSRLQSFFRFDVYRAACRKSFVC